MRTVKLNEIIPGKLYQRGQFMTFPVISKIQMLERYDIGMVVNLWYRPDPELHIKDGLIYIHWPIGGGEVPFMDSHMINFLNDHLSNGTKVLVHCEAGVNRSIWLATRLVMKQEVLSGAEAFQIVSNAVGRTKVRSGLMVDLDIPTPRDYF